MRQPPVPHGGIEFMPHLVTEELCGGGNDSVPFASGDALTEAVVERDLIAAMAKGRAYEYDHYTSAAVAAALERRGLADLTMSITVWLSARTLNYPGLGGHFWVYLNWALGLRALGCDLVWLEPVAPGTPVSKVQAMVHGLKGRLEPYGLADSVALCSSTNEPLSSAMAAGCQGIGAASEADLFLNMSYAMSPAVIRRFRRTALLDIDPGLTQIWMSKGQINVARHDLYLTIGETVGQPGARFPDCGLEWQYTPPCIALDWWPVHSAPAGAPFTTVSNWYMDEWIEDTNGWYINDKRSGFLPFLDLPAHTSQPLELALCLKPDEEEGWVALPKRGWIVRDAWEAASTPRDYQRYIQNSRGEFSCVKPSCVRLQNAWISDRTLCYLASGKPAVVQHTGPSRFLPDSAGLFRFRDLDEAVRYLDIAAGNYDQQCSFARALAEEFFDAKKVVRGVLERALVIRAGGGVRNRLGVPV